MHMVKKALFSILWILAIWGAARLSHHKTDGFRMEKLRGNTTGIAEQASLAPSLDQRAVLSGKFTYFGRGLQSFSFLSEDGETVLKLFNNRYQKRLFWLSLTPSVGPLKKWKTERVAYLKKKLHMTFESYQLAYEKLTKQTGLIYLHLQRSRDLLPEVAIVDNLGIEHKIDLNEVGFALQKKATMAYAYLDKCALNQDLGKARLAISQLVQLLKGKMEMGIADRDPLIRTNFGFLNDRPMQIDIGPLSLDPHLKNSERQREEIKKITLSLKHWLETKHPEMTPFLTEALENL